MFKTVLLAGILLLFNGFTPAQAAIQKLVDTEHAFAKQAADTNTKDAFLAYMAGDAVVFMPEMKNANAVWKARAVSNSLLEWAPNFADVSSNGVIGYTTGNWQWRENRSGAAPSAFGDFITVWVKQSGGGYKWVIDIGVTHDKPAAYSTDWHTASRSVGKDEPSGEFAAAFYQVAAAKGVVGAYDKFAGDNIRSYREGKPPILGKKAALAELKSDKPDIAFAKRSTAINAGDLGYILNTYTKFKGGKEIEKGNYLQIWKFYDRKWHIVLDIFKPVPAS